MKLQLKRPTQVYLFHGLWIVATIFYTTRNSSDFGRLFLIFMTCVATVSFISLLMRRNYFEIKDKKLIINKEFFRTHSIDLDNIEKFNIEPGPFASSKIILRDNTAIKYMDSQVNNKELKEFMGQFNIPVE
jgi:hypothetical protein